MIYFIKATQSGAIKIGVSNNPRKRLGTMQTGSAEPLELLGVIPGQYDEEKRLHERFQRFRMHGEWFKGDGEFVQAIEIMLRPSIPELIDRAGARLWFIRGTADITDDDGNELFFESVSLLCVCLKRSLLVPPNHDDMLQVLWPDIRYSWIDVIIDATKRPELWPDNHELLRNPLENRLFDIWVGDIKRSRQFEPLPLSVAMFMKDAERGEKG